jgi:hypothetical protein
LAPLVSSAFFAEADLAGEVLEEASWLPAFFDDAFSAGPLLTVPPF